MKSPNEPWLNDKKKEKAEKKSPKPPKRLIAEYIKDWVIA
jgi:hypothetical protein